MRPLFSNMNCTVRELRELCEGTDRTCTGAVVAEEKKKTHGLPSVPEREEQTVERGIARS